eukprot:g125.t1
MESNNVVKEGEFVVISTSKGDAKVVRAESRGKIKWGRRITFLAKSLIGIPFGSVVELRKSTLVVVDGDLIPDLSKWIGEDDMDTSTDKDNRNLVDTNTSQLLTSDEITKMKSKGATGEDIISALVENSETFKGKTKFSKAKYLKKKVSKFVTRMRIERVRPDTLWRCQFQKRSEKLCDLRYDSLAQILSYSDLEEGSDILVFDGTGGFVSSSIAYRKGADNGFVFSCHRSEDQGAFNIFQQQFFNFESDVENTIVHFSMKRLHDLDSAVESGANGGDAKNVLKVKSAPAEGTETAVEAVIATETSTPSDSATASNRASKQERYEARQVRVEKKRKLLREHLSAGADGLVIVCDGMEESPLEVLHTLLPFLKLSRPFILFCPYIEPLSECFRFLVESKPDVAIDVQLTETWTRSIQVLPMRTHPTMQMHGHSGYLLRGVRIDGRNDEPAFATDARSAFIQKRTERKRARKKEKRGPTTTTTTTTTTQSEKKKAKHPTVPGAADECAGGSL